ncbi:uncharacterized protein LOC143028317 [Oratosquilla oratoria]|uniref:uncharacterized protein LOC143028317 n=1 Tax=Oratosquilla oratoria TaxID=337810 RepID=UPI003F76A4A8
MKGLPKIHKPGIPLRPITSGIGCATHRSTKVLAKPLSSVLGSISGTHLRNSTNMIERLSNVDFSGKKLVSYDITSLFTHVSTDAAVNAIKEAVHRISEENLPTDEGDILSKLNKVVRNIQFTMEVESHGRLPFLDSEIIRNGKEALFRVYRKPTNKDDLIHYYSAHDERTKTGVVIGFFLRALRICSQKFLDEEISLIKTIFRKLGYPEAFLSTSLKKAQNIRRRKDPVKRDRQYLIVPGSNLTHTLGAALWPLGLETINDTGKKIRNLVTPTTKVSAHPPSSPA